MIKAKLFNSKTEILIDEVENGMVVYPKDVIYIERKKYKVKNTDNFYENKKIIEQNIYVEKI